MTGSSFTAAVTAVSPLRDVFDGSGGASKDWPAAQKPTPKPSWHCQVLGCGRSYSRNECERILQHLEMHYASWGPRSTVPCKWMPELAEHLLDRAAAHHKAHGTRTRRALLPSKVDELTRAITSGHWCYDGNPIGLSDAGIPVQGGHRLSAFVAAGEDLDGAITFGLPPEASVSMDTSRKQSFQNVLAAMGEKCARDRGALAALLWQFEQGQLSPGLSWHKRKVPGNQELLDFYQEHREEVISALAAGRRVASVTPFARGPALGLAWLLISRANSERPDDVECFFSSLRLGGAPMTPHGEKDPAAAWQRKFTSQKPHDKLRSEDQAALTIKAWNSCLIAKPVPYLAWRKVGGDAEEFPVPKAM